MTRKEVAKDEKEQKGWQNELSAREDKNENEMVEGKASKSEFQFVSDTEDPLPHTFERFVQPLPPSGHENNIYKRIKNCKDLKLWGPQTHSNTKIEAKITKLKKEKQTCG